MAITYPLTPPSTGGFRGVLLAIDDAVGFQASPLTFEQTLYDWGGDVLSGEVQLAPMKRADAEEWVAFLWALRGQVGTFLGALDTVHTSPRGTWSGGSPLVNGAHSAGMRTLTLDNLAAGATGKAGDWLQYGSATTARLAKVLQDFTADGSGNATVEIGPRTRYALADNAAITLASPKGLWRLAESRREYSIDLAQVYGLTFRCVEALAS